MSSDEQPKTDVVGEVVKWIVTIIAVFLFIRLIILLFKVAINAIGLIADGNTFDRLFTALSTMTPLNIVVQLLIIATVVTLYFLDRNKKSHNSDSDSPS